MAKHTFAVGTPQDFESMFGHFTTLYMKGLKHVCPNFNLSSEKIIFSCRFARSCFKRKGIRYTNVFNISAYRRGKIWAIMYEKTNNYTVFLNIDLTFI